jgi:hypothetical protein
VGVCSAIATIAKFNQGLGTPGSDERFRGRGTQNVPSKKPLDEEYWLERAREAYAHAGRMTHAEAKRMMLEIAAGYQRLAQSTEERTGRRKVWSS